jgi:uncharacterized protein (TIGR02466 family)
MIAPNVDLMIPFGVPIAKCIISDDKQDEIEKHTIPQLYKLRHTGQQYSDYNFPNELSIFSELNRDLSVLADEIKKATYAYIRTTGFQMVKLDILDQVWVQDYKEGDIHSEHTHGGQCISGLYWVRANEDAGEIQFKNPNPYLPLWEPARETELSTSVITFKAKKGVLLLWPGYLTHGVIAGGKNCERTTIAFNLDFTKEVYNY